jgi:hypothetical protein
MTSEVHDALIERKLVDAASDLCRELKKGRLLLFKLDAIDNQLCSKYGAKRDNVHAIVLGHVASDIVIGRNPAVN